MKTRNVCPGKNSGCRPLLLACGMILSLLPGHVNAKESTEIAQKIELKSVGFPKLPGNIEGGLVGKIGGSLLAAIRSETPRNDGALSIWTSPSIQ